jgi:hypothetical protein
MAFKQRSPFLVYFICGVYYYIDTPVCIFIRLAHVIRLAHDR